MDLCIQFQFRQIPGDSVAVAIWDRQLWHLIPNRLKVQELKLD